MKYILTLTICVTALQVFSQVSITGDGSPPDQSAMFQIESPDKGLIIPRMSTSQREGILNPANGLLVYDIDRQRIWQYDNGWFEMLNEQDYQKLQVFNDTMMLTKGGGFIDLGATFEGLGYDLDNGNEIQLLQIFNDTMMLTQGGGFIDLGATFEGLGYDLDNTNEIQMLQVFNDTMMLTNGGGIVDLGATFEGLGYDLDNGNEIQMLQIFNDTMMLTNGGGFVDLGATFEGLGYDLDDENEIQLLQIFNDTMMLTNGGGFIDLSEMADNLGWDRDIDNEIQALNWVNDSLLYITQSASPPIRKSQLNYWSSWNDTMMIFDGSVRVGNTSDVAVRFDEGKSELKNSFNMLATDRNRINFILDADNDQTSTSFALFNNKTGSPIQAAVSFALDPNVDSWINSGDFGIGTNNPISDLHVLHKGSTISDGVIFENTVASTAFRIFVNNNGNMLLYTTESEGSSPVGGFNGVTGAYLSSSDERRKTNIQEIESLTDKLEMLRPVKYHFKGSETASLSYGFLAQDVAKVFPELVDYNAEADTYLMDYSGFGVLAVAAYKEQQAEIRALHDENRELRNRLEIVEKELTELIDLKAQLTRLIEVQKER